MFEHWWKMGGLGSEKNKVLWRDKCWVGEANKAKALITKPGQSNSNNWCKLLAPYRKEFLLQKQRIRKGNNSQFFNAGSKIIFFHLKNSLFSRCRTFPCYYQAQNTLRNEGGFVTFTQKDPVCNLCVLNNSWISMVFISITQAMFCFLISSIKTYLIILSPDLTLVLFLSV